MTTDKQSTDGTIFEFLNGSHSFDGVLFGEPHPILTGNFWWRKFLPTQQDKAAHTVTAWVEKTEKLIEAVQHLFDMKKQKGSTIVMNNAWNIVAMSLYDTKEAIKEVQIPIKGYSEWDIVLALMKLSYSSVDREEIIKSLKQQP